MYATCTFCHGALGRNESIEVFPVGKRLAFDGDKGRLWVICPQCSQWNLSPLDERWEAIESAERLFRGTKLRHSTTNIGLAKLADGTELIRIGSPLRPEMAAWRYGSVFAKRWRGMAIGAGTGSAIFLGATLLLPTSGAAAAFAATLLAAGGAAVGTVGAQLAQAGGRTMFKGQLVVDNEQQYLRVSPKELGFVNLVSHGDGWGLRVPFRSRGPTIENHWHDIIDLGGIGTVTISGQPAVTAARQLLPLINARGARQSAVQEAVSLASDWNSAENAFAWSLKRSRELIPSQYFGDPGSLYHLPAPVRLGLEMALHEDIEQRALEGELAELERAWKDAETIAGISDGMFVSGPVDRLLMQLKRRNPLA